MNSISNITSAFSKILAAVCLTFFGLLLFMPHKASANETTSTISDIDDTCEWISDSKISCDGYDFFFMPTLTVNTGNAVYKNFDDDGNQGGVYIIINRSGTAASGTFSTSGETPTNAKAVELTANGKMYERRTWAPKSKPKDFVGNETTRWDSSIFRKDTGEYDGEEDDSFSAYFLCGLLSRKGQTCIRQATGDTTTISEEGGDKIADVFKSIKSGIDSAANCDSNSLSFILCPLLDGMKSAVNFLIGDGGKDAGVLGNLLTVKPLSTDDQLINDAGDPIPNYTLQVWSRLRDFSLALMIIIFIVIVFGNGLGIEAYTVKRAIPRLALGSLLTFGSFYILQTLIDLSNVLGRAVPSLLSIVSPNGTNLSNGFSFNLDLGFGGGLVAVILILILYFLALVAVLIGIAGLIARQLIIYALVLTAPFAFVMWVLPSTEKLFKKWWSNLIKVLMMYPIVTGMLALALLFQQIVGLDAQNQPFAVKLVGAVAPLIALMAIPKTFKMGGELFTGAAGFAAGWATKGTDLGKGLAKNSATNARNRTVGGMLNKASATLNDEDASRRDRALAKVRMRGAAALSGKNPLGRRGLVSAAQIASKDLAEQTELETARAEYMSGDELKGALGRSAARIAKDPHNVREIARFRALQKRAISNRESDALLNAKSIIHSSTAGATRYAAISAPNLGDMGDVAADAMPGASFDINSVSVDKIASQHKSTIQRWTRDGTLAKLDNQRLQQFNDPRVWQKLSQDQLDLIHQEMSRRGVTPAFSTTGKVYQQTKGPAGSIDPKHWESK